MKNKILKFNFELFENLKDQVLHDFVRNAKLERKDLERLYMTLKSSLEDSFFKHLQVFEKKLDKELKGNEKSKTQEISLKKKNS